MHTLISLTCGCSPVRSGITRENTVVWKDQGKEHAFCCDGCSAMFRENAEALSEETNKLVVCPSCLAENQPIDQAVLINYEGNTLSDRFHEAPEYYIKRLSGEIEHVGVFSEGRGCCG